MHCTDPAHSVGTWPLPPPRGVRRGHRLEVLFTRVLFQASFQNTLALRNPPPTRLSLLTKPALDRLPPYSAPLRCRSPHHLYSVLPSLPSPGPSLLNSTVYLSSHVHLHFFPSPTKQVFLVSKDTQYIPSYNPALLLRMALQYLLISTIPHSSSLLLPGPSLFIAPGIYHSSFPSPLSFTLNQPSGTRPNHIPAPLVTGLLQPPNPAS